MGKRELLLIVGFVILGVVVHQATAPPPGPDERGLSLARLLDSARREIRGNRATAEVATTTILPIDDEVTELRISESGRGAIHLTGEDRPDMEASLHVVSNAYDDAEARQTAEQTVLRTDRAASSLLLRIEYPEPGRQRTTLTLRVPRRLQIRIESRPETLTIADVAGVEATNAGGQTTVTGVAGRVALTHRGGPVVIEEAGSLRFTGRQSRLIVRGVGGDTSLVMEQGGTVTASRLAGPVDIESRSAAVTLDELASTRGPIRVNAVGGSVALKRVNAETRVDGRNAEIDVTMAGAVPLAIYSTGANVALTPPASAHNLDIVALGGEISPSAAVAELGLDFMARGAEEQRATGAVRGGGPEIAIRTTRGDVVLRSPEP